MVIQISKGNSKMGGSIPSISLVPIKDCMNCSECKDFCYAARYYGRYPATRAAYTRNSQIFRQSPVDGVRQISEWIDRRRIQPKYFRFHVSGDMLNQAHVTAYIWLTKKYPHIKFLAFTKRHDLNFRNVPSNLKIIHSYNPSDEIRVRYKFNAYVVDGVDDVRGFVCGGSCENCKECFEGIERIIIFNKH